MFSRALAKYKAKKGQISLAFLFKAHFLGLIF
jgi:uncharacterized protein (UPF0333 family)